MRSAASAIPADAGACLPVAMLTQAGAGDRLRVLVGLGEGDLEGPLVGTAQGFQFEGAAASRRECVEQVIRCAGWLARGSHDKVARGEAGPGGGAGFYHLAD